jgi:plasmid stability protein
LDIGAPRRLSSVSQVKTHQGRLLDRTARQAAVRGVVRSTIMQEPALRLDGPTCAAHVAMLERMPKMIQIRNVPDEIHRKLKARAAAAGLTLSEMLSREAKLLAEQPTLAELTERIARRARVKLRKHDEVVRIIREERGE